MIKEYIRALLTFRLLSYNIFNTQTNQTLLDHDIENNKIEVKDIKDSKKGNNRYEKITKLLWYKGY